MAVSYDENVIVSFAERLYRRASSMVAAGALLRAIVGALPVVIAMELSRTRPNAIAPVAVVVGLIGLAIGAAIGSERAFTLRLLAQQALCQVQIERNTRAAAMGVAPVRTAHPPPIPRG